MNNVPVKLKKKWKEEDLRGMVRECMRSEEGNCQGRITKEHALTYKGKQIQEEWAILDICAFHHEVDQFQDGGGMDKKKHVWIALNRASDERLGELSKGEDKIALKRRLNAIYGVYKPNILNI